MASPQVENGFTRLSNELFEALIRNKFNGTQYSIILAVIRATYGFHQKSRTLGLSFFRKTTGRNKRQIAKEIHELIDMNVLTVEAKHTFGTSRELKLNKDYETWRFDRKGMVQKQHRGYVAKDSPTYVANDSLNK
ncbi:MAG: replication protein [Bacteroidota bacterium]